MCAAGLPAAEVLSPFLERDPQRVAIYATTETSPQNYRAARDLFDVHEGFAEAFRRRNHPKLYFTQVANLPAAQLGIFLGVHGPVNVYKHSAFAALHALEQAELDLASGLVDAALVWAAMSLEDPLLGLQVRRIDERRSADPAAAPVLSEGAGALVLGRGGGETDWSRVLGSDRGREVCYGIAGPILDLIDKEISLCPPPPSS